MDEQNFVNKPVQPDFEEENNGYVPDFAPPLAGESFINVQDSEQKHPDSDSEFLKDFQSLTGTQHSCSVSFSQYGASRNRNMSEQQPLQSHSRSQRDAFQNHGMTEQIPVWSQSRSKSHHDRGQPINQKSGKRILNEFRKFDRKFQKKEFIHMSIFRWMRKVFQGQNDLKPDNILKQFDQELFHELMTFIQGNQAYITNQLAFFKPAWDLPRGDPRKDRCRFKTYAQDFITVWSSRQILREFGQKFLDMIFEDLSHNKWSNLITFFKFKWCSSEYHEETCEHKWTKLRDWLFQSLNFDADPSAEPPYNPTVQQTVQQISPQQTMSVIEEEYTEFPNNVNVDDTSSFLMDVHESNGPFNDPITPLTVPAIPIVKEVTLYDQNIEDRDVTLPEFINVASEKDWGDLNAPPTIPRYDKVTTSDPNTEDVYGTQPDRIDNIEPENEWVEVDAMINIEQ